MEMQAQGQALNQRAQALYESLGWQRDDVYLTYNLPLTEAA